MPTPPGPAGTGTSPSRRAVLRAAPAVAVAALAGCQSASEDGVTDGEPTPELPNVGKRIVQRDRAAIAHVRTLVSGRIEWPSLTVENDGIAQVVGVWESSSEALRLDPDSTFSLRSSEGRVGGTFLANEAASELILQPEGGEATRYTYSREAGESGPQLVVRSDGELVGRYEQTGGRPDAADTVEMLTNLRIGRDPDGQTEGGEIESGSSGSGFFVSADGYLVSNAHVVLADTDPAQLLFDELANRLATDLRSTLQADLAADLDDAQIDRVSQAMYERVIAYLSRDATTSDVTEEYTVRNGTHSDGEDGRGGVQGWPATVEREGTVVSEVDGEPSWGRDVAVLSVDRSDLPVVDLASDPDLTTGDEIYVVGYPDIGVQELFEDSDTALEPTLTTGVVSARRTLNSGVETIQTDAGINQGNSGGPMYDTDGEVVGIATFGPADAGIESVAFGLPIAEAKTFLDALGVDNESGEVDTAFDAGIEAYWRGDCATATDRFERVRELSPDHPTVAEFLADCEAGDAPGQ